MQNKNKEKPISEKSSITMEMLNVGNSITIEQKQELLNLVNKYRDCFALNLRELGCTDLFEVEFTDNNQPVRRKPYRQPRR